MEIDNLIKNLSKDVDKVTLKNPAYYFFYAGFILIIYVSLSQCYLGFRSDLSSRILEVNFLLEITLLSLIALSGLIGSILTIYPDAYQKKIFLKIPIILSAILLAWLFFRIFFDSKIYQTESTHNIECSICIAALSFLPALLIFILIKRGATTNPKNSGFLAILTATSIGCLIIRIAEINDLANHLLIWHYLPSLIFSCLGVFVGKYLLRW